MISIPREKIFKTLMVLGMIGIFTYMLSPFFIPILLAAIFGFALDPVVSKISTHTGINRKTCAWLVLFLFIAAVIGVTTLVSTRFYTELTDFQVGDTFSKAAITERVDRILSKFNIGTSMTAANIVQKASENIVHALGRVVGAFVAFIPNMILSTLVFCAALFFFVTQGANLKHLFVRLKLLNGKDLATLIHMLKMSSTATLFSTIVVAIVQATIMTLGSMVLAVGNPILVFEFTFVLSFIPIIGTTPVAIALIGTAIAASLYWKAVALLLIALMVSATDNLIKVYVMGKVSQGVHPVISLLALVGALIVFGVPGLFLGPVLTGVIMGVLPAFMNLTSFPPTRVLKKETFLKREVSTHLKSETGASISSEKPLQH